jgi:hypothetical protein
MTMWQSTGSLPYCLERWSPLARYVIDFVCSVLGLHPQCLTREEAGQTPHLYYGNNPLATSRIAIPACNADPVWSHVVDVEKCQPDGASRVSFDVIHAIGMLLTDEVNERLPTTAWGPADRLLFDRSFQARHGIAHLPIVNHFVQLVAALIQRQLGARAVSLWPEGKRAAIGISHDVDRPEKYAMLRAVRDLRYPALRIWPRFYAKALYQALQRLRDPCPDDFWLFEQIMDAESKLGLKSTFFFASMPSYGRWGAFEDVTYDIGWPRFGPLFQSIAERGFEIGLHASYNAHRASSRLAWERWRLEQVAGVPIKGLRHHYWHLGRNPNRTLRFHEECGFEYDSSLAFNEHMGFRRNVALPFYPWDAERSRPLRTLQLPTFCMDGNLFYRRTDVESAAHQVQQYVEAIKRLGGVGVIDWHVRTSYPGNVAFRDWSLAYLEIIRSLAADHELWVTNLGEIADWVSLRERSIKAAESHACVV